MKKTYYAPEVTVVNIQTTNFLATSTPDVKLDNGYYNEEDDELI